MDSFAQIIDAFGGPGAFAEAIGIPDSHARAMKTRNSIPDGYWLRAARAAEVRGLSDVTLERFAILAGSKLEEKVPQ